MKNRHTQTKSFTVDLSLLIKHHAIPRSIACSGPHQTYTSPHTQLPSRHTHNPHHTHICGPRLRVHARRPNHLADLAIMHVLPAGAAVIGRVCLVAARRGRAVAVAAEAVPVLLLYE